MEGLEGQGGDVEAGSPPATDPSATQTLPAATPPVPGVPPAEKQPPFHQHPRFQEVTRQNRELKQAVTQLNQQMQALQQKSQAGPGLSPEEQTQYSEAAKALRKVMENDPELAALLQGAKQFPQLTQSHQIVGQLHEAQQRAQQQQATSHIGSLAKDAGFPADPKFLQHLTRMVASEAMSLPDAEARYGRGDLTVLTEAFAVIKDQVLGQMQRQQTQALRDTKTRTRALPPAPRGGFSTPDAQAKPVPGKEREYEQKLHATAIEKLRSAFGG